MSNENPGTKLEEIAKQVRTFLHEELCNETGPPKFSLEDDILTSGRVDSLGVMRLIEFLELRFATSIPMEDVTVENFMSCETIAAYVLTHGPN